MTVAVLIPWQAGCPHRAAALDWTLTRLEHAHPDWTVHLGDGATPDGFSRTRGLLHAAAQAPDADRYVCMDGDVGGADLLAAFEAMERTGWAIPHRLIHRLSRAATRQLLDTPELDWKTLPLSDDNPQDARPYVGHAAGTLVVLSRTAFELAPPDPRFVGWGSEDDAWAIALRTLVGQPWRGTDDLVHLWHPPQPRETRIVGNRANLALKRRYMAARRNPAAMRVLLDETRVAA
jgi:hypothetical protein